MTEVDRLAVRQSQHCPCPAHRYARGETVHRGGRKWRRRGLTSEEWLAVSVMGVWAVAMFGFVAHIMTIN